MKNPKIYFIAFLSILIISTSCTKDEIVIKPVAAFELYWQHVDLSNQKLLNDKVKYIPETDTLIVYRNEQLVFKNVGSGTHFSIWTGDTGANIDILNNTGSNFPLTSGGVDFLKVYTTKGNYKLWIFATTASANGAIVEKSSLSAVIKVVDKP